MTKYIDPTFTLNEGMEEEWKSGVEKNQDDYGFCVYEFANEWATLMERAIKDGAKLEEVFMDLSHEADKKYGISGFMFGAAASMLSSWWIHGDELRVAHNKRYGVDADEEGTINPAILTVDIKEDEDT